MWVTGDTVVHRDLFRAVRDVQVDVMVVHVGGVRFRSTVPVHYEGWTQFADGPGGLERALDAAPADVRARIRRLPMGVRTEL